MIKSGEENFQTYKISLTNQTFSDNWGIGMILHFELIDHQFANENQFIKQSFNRKLLAGGLGAFLSFSSLIITKYC